MATINTSTESMRMQVNIRELPPWLLILLIRPAEDVVTRDSTALQDEECAPALSQRDKLGWRIAQVQKAAADIDPAHCAVRINILIINYGFQQPTALHIFPRAFVCLLHCVAHCTPLVALICKHGRCMSTEITLAGSFPKSGVRNSRSFFMLLMLCIRNRKSSDVHIILETYPWLPLVHNYWNSKFFTFIYLF